MRKLFTLKILLFVLFSGLGNYALGQSNPLPQTIPYSQDFSTLAHTSTTYPSGWQGWTIGSSNTTTFRTVAPTADRALTASGTASMNGGNIYNYNSKIGFLTTGSLDVALALALDATGKTNITVSYDAMTIRNPYDGSTNTRFNELTLQYRIGTSGTFTTLTGIEYQNNTTLQTGTGVTTPQNVQSKNITLPAACNNQPVVQIRWVNRDAGGGGARPSFAVDNISVTGVTLLSSNANLANLTISSGTLTPSFTSANTSYTASVASNVSSMTVTPTASETHATINVNTYRVASGSASQAIGLSVGDNTITILDTAEDRTTTKTYTVIVNRATPGVPALSSTSLADFGNVCINTTVGPNSFTLNGINLDGTTISVGALPGFSYSETPDGTYTNTVSFSYTGDNFSGKVIYVKFTPTAVQSYNGNINVSGGGVGSYDVPATGSGVNSGPSITNGNSSAVTATTVTLTDTISVAGCSAITAYGFEYSLSTGFPNGTGTQVLSSNLSGGIFSATITGLTPNQQYFYRAFVTTSGGTTYGSQRSFINAPLPVTMASQQGLSYTEDFHDIANWSNFFITGIGANHFDGLSATGSGGIPNGTTITASTNSFQGSPGSPSASGGVHRGTDQATPTESIVLLSTGSSPENSTSAAIDLYLDFTGVNAGTLSFDWTSINNGDPTSNRKGSLRIYASMNGISFSEITSAAVLNFTNYTPTSGSISNITLPASFNNSATARLRFYYSNGTGGTTGSRPKISIDNLTITAVPSTPCSTPTAQPSSMVFGTITDVSIAGSFSAASPASDQYLTIVSTNSSLTADPTDGVTYNVGDAFGDGTIIAKGSSLNFNATGLSPATSYYFFTYAVNGVCTGGPKYLTANPLVNSATTNSPLPSCAAPSSQASNLVFGNVSINSIQGSFTSTTADEYLVLVSTAASLSISPVNGTIYNTGEVIGNAKVVQRSAATTFTANGLTAGTQYYFFVFSLNSQNCLNGPAYNKVEPLSGSQVTQPLPPCTTPTSQPTLLSLNAANNSISGTFNPSGSADDYLIVRSTSSSLTSSPADTTDYSVGASLGGGIVISNSSSTSFLTSNLSTGTTYYFFVFAANKNCSGGTKYLTASPLTGSATTTSFVQNNYYYGTLHSHSDYSDGNKDHPGYTPADDYNYAMTAQCLDFLGISEHNHFSSPDNPGNTIANYHKGPLQADSFTTVHPNFVALYGMEWGVISGGGHVVVYGDGMNKLFGWESGNGGWGPTDNYDVYVPKSVYTGPTGLFKTVNDFRDQNTFATLAHPNQTDFNNLAGVPYDLVADSAIVGTAVETGPATSTNTTYSNPGSSMSYLWYYQTMLSKGYHLGPTIDHDNHNTTFGHTTFARTAVIAPALNKTEIIKAMRDMHFYSTEDCDSKVDFTVNTRMMGSVFSDRNAPAISVTLSDLTTSTSSAIIRLMYGKPGSGVLPVKIDSAIGNTLYFVDNNLPNGETGYYYIDITNGTSRIVTSPIWYTRTCSVESNTTIYSCNSYEWNGQTYTESGTYSKPGMISTGGCDSTAVLHLTITTPTSGDTTVVACDSYTWYGNTYTESGTATKALKERGGCDSTVTLHLTINHSTTTSETDAACDSYTWHDSTYTTSGVYTYQSLNAQGCTNTDTLHLTIEDTQDPTINAPSDFSVNADNGSCAATNVALGTPVADDNCGVASVTNNAPATFPVGQTTVTWTVTDTHGRTATAAQTVTVTDNQDPTITAPSNVSVNADNGSCVATNVSLGTPVTNDNCGVAGVSNDAPASFPVGQTTVIWTVTDTHGRTATAAQTVTVTDNQDPTITAPSNVSVNADNGSCAATNVVLGTPVTNDNCGVASVTNDAPASFPVGQTIVTWTVTDTHGRTATATQIVIVTDNQDPTISAPSSVSVNADNGSCAATNVALGTPVTNDNCAVASVTNDAPASFPVGQTTVTWTVTDTHGRTATATQTVTVTDNQDPTITAPSSVSVNADNGSCAATNVALGTPITNDNCGVASVSNDAPSSFPVGQTTVTWIVTDTHGRTATAAQTVTVTDNQDPVITHCPATSVQCYNNAGTYTISSLTATDNCAVQSITYTITGATSRNGNMANASGVFDPGTSTINWTVTDIHGNTSSCSTTVVIDKVDLVIPDTYAANITASIGKPNTIYIGYGGTSITLTAQASSSVSSNSFSYKWTTGSPSGPVVGTGNTITVSPTTTTVYYLSIKDINNCKPLTQITKQVTVENIVCGSGKITVCVPQKNGSPLTSCVSSSQSSINKLPTGWYLGACQTPYFVSARTIDQTKAISGKINVPDVINPDFEVSVSPNPSATGFKLVVQSNSAEPITIRLQDISGRILGQVNKVQRNESVSVGNGFIGGTYFAEVIQGSKRKIIKLVKL